MFPPLPDDALTCINALSESCSRQLWAEYISPTHRHFKRLSANDWPVRLCRESHASGRAINYKTEWYEKQSAERYAAYDEIQSHLHENVSWHASTTVFFFWSRDCSVQTVWHVFVKYWPHFLFNDEGCILISEMDDVAAVVYDGFLMLGRRPLA
jgi:hypothetical protein